MTTLIAHGGLVPHLHGDASLFLAAWIVYIIIGVALRLLRKGKD